MITSKDNVIGESVLKKKRSKKEYNEKEYNENLRKSIIIGYTLRESIGDDTLIALMLSNFITKKSDRKLFGLST